MRDRAIGFLINPIAGMGGRVGLKGTDNVIKKAREMGAQAIASRRALEFLAALKRITETSSMLVVTCSHPMGECEVKSNNLNYEIIPLVQDGETTAKDTKAAVQIMVKKGIELIVFVGGDGTARDILDVLKDNNTIQVLGVPSGVKMYSGIFTITPTEAAEVIQAYLVEETQVIDFEIMDADETAIRFDQFSVQLYGYLKGPYIPLHFQGSKQISGNSIDELENQKAVARSVFEDLNLNNTYILGPGTTIKHITDILGTEKTLLGVDIYHEGRLIKDVNEAQIMKEIPDFKHTWIVVSPIGHQGIIFGRGNQQISPEIIKKVGKEKIIVVATNSKLQGISDMILRVDTGDSVVDALLRGYIKVMVDYHVWRMVPVQ